jgi:hypothetical protein
MKLHYQMTGTDMTPVTESIYRNQLEARAIERGIKIEWTRRTIAATDVETIKDRISRGMERQAAITEHRAKETDLQYVFPQSLYKIVSM